MSIARKVGVVIVAIMLTTTFLMTAAVGAAHLTVLDPDFVTTSIEEEGGYELVGDMLREGAAGEASAAGDGQVDGDQFVEDAVTEEYVQSQTDANVHRAFAYLHGNSDELNLSISTTPIQDNLADGFQQQIANASIAELVALSDAELAGPIDAETLERMNESQSSYQQEKADLRGDIREEVVAAAVDEAFETSSNDELIRAAGEDPDQYSEPEKERFVREYESEIRAALREQIEDERGDEIDAQVDERLDGLADDASANSAETEMEQATADVQMAVVNGLKSDTTYEEFQSEYVAAEDDLRSAASGELDQELSEGFPDRIDLLGEESDEPPEPIQQARTGVIWFDRLSFVFPVAILGLVGMLYAIRRSAVSVASDAGISMLLAGLPAVIAVEIGRSQLQSMVAEAPPGEQQALEVASGIAGRGLGTLGNLGLVLTVGGVALIGVSLAFRYGLLDGLLGGGSAGAAGGSGGDAGGAADGAAETGEDSAGDDAGEDDTGDGDHSDAEIDEDDGADIDEAGDDSDEAGGDSGDGGPDDGDSGDGDSGDGDSGDGDDPDDHDDSERDRDGEKGGPEDVESADA